MPTSRSYHSYLIESLKDPQEAAAYLEATLEEGDDEQLRLALNHIAEAQLGDLNNIQLASSQEFVNKMLSQQLNLDLSSLLKLLDELGFKLSVTPKDHVA